MHDVTTSFRKDLPLAQGNLFVRLQAAKAIACLRKCTLADVIEAHWPSDRIIERAATAPAMTNVSGWAAELAQKLVSDALTALGPASAAAEILQNGLVLSFDGHGQISAPGFVAEFGNAGWVAEGQAIPVRQLTATPATLDPHKLTAIAVLTQEMIDSSNAEALIGDALMRAAGRMIDEVLFDANPGDNARPKGLRNGVAASTPSNNSDFIQASLEDMATLVNAIAPVAGNGPYIFVASPGRAAMLSARHTGISGLDSKVKVFGSSAVVNDLLAIAPQALVSALSPDPEIETSNAGTLVMIDTNPPGVPGAAGPERNMFQINSAALKMRWPVTWALRDARGFAWMTPVWK